MGDIKGRQEIIIECDAQNCALGYSCEIPDYKSGKLTKYYFCSLKKD
jgi:hypothetical protein